jgi:hypothetical protein
MPTDSLSQLDFFWFIASIPALSIGHGFGIIPAPGSFVAGMQRAHFAFPERRPGSKQRTSAFPVPPNKSSETPSKISCVPPKKQPLALGAVSARSSVPQLQGQKRRKKMYQNRVHLIGYLGKNPEHKSVRASDRKYAVLSLATQPSWKNADDEWAQKTSTRPRPSRFDSVCYPMA